MSTTWLLKHSACLSFLNALKFWSSRYSLNLPFHIWNFIQNYIWFWTRQIIPWVYLNHRQTCIKWTQIIPNFRNRILMNPIIKTTILSVKIEHFKHSELHVTITLCILVMWQPLFGHKHGQSRIRKTTLFLDERAFVFYFSCVCTYASKNKISIKLSMWVVHYQ